MDKKLFHETIEVPKEDVLKAIRAGIDQANSMKTPRGKYKRIRVITISAVAAAVTLISSSFILPSVSRVLAEVPFLEKLYEHDLVGKNLASQQLITQLNKTASDKGIDVAITGAYYDGAVIGVDFHIKGEVEKDKAGQYLALYEIFDGDESMGETKELVYLNPTDKGYAGHIQLNYPKAELPPEATFPLAFLRIGKEEGGWKFDVPIKQLPYETAEVDKESSDIHSNIKVHFDSIIAGRSSTAIDYTATFPNERTKDQVRLEIYDDQGKRFERLTDGIDLAKNKGNNELKVAGRTIIPQSVKGKTTYLEIKPSVALYERDQVIPVDRPAPIEIKSNRQNLVVKVEKMLVEERWFTVDFQVNNGEYNKQHFTLFEDFARNDVSLVKQSEKDIYEEPLKHSLNVLDKENLRFKSTFDISKIDDLQDYVLRVNLNSLGMNMPVELESVKINLEE